MPGPTIPTPLAAGQVWADRMTGARIRIGDELPNGLFVAHYGSDITGELNAETLELLYEEVVA
jgi:hypothetical protein